MAEIHIAAILLVEGNGDASIAPVLVIDEEDEDDVFFFLWVLNQLIRLTIVIFNDVWVLQVSVLLPILIVKILLGRSSFTVDNITIWVRLLLFLFLLILACLGIGSVLVCSIRVIGSTEAFRHVLILLTIVEWCSKWLLFIGVAGGVVGLILICRGIPVFKHVYSWIRLHLTRCHGVFIVVFGLNRLILGRFIILIQATASDGSSCIRLQVFITLFICFIEVVVVIIVHLMVSSHRVVIGVVVRPLVTLTFIILHLILLVVGVGVVMVGAIVAVVSFLAVSLISISYIVLLLIQWTILIFDLLVLVGCCSWPATLALLFTTTSFTALHARLLLGIAKLTIVVGAIQPAIVSLGIFGLNVGS